MKITHGKVVYAFSEKEGEIPSLQLTGVLIEGDECPQSTLVICNDVPSELLSFKGDALRKAMRSYAEDHQTQILRNSISLNHVRSVHRLR